VSVVVTVVIIGAIVSLSAGVVTAVVSALSLRKKRKLAGGLIVDEPVYWSFTLWTTLLGIFLALAPQSWYGPSWSYFHMIPSNGFGMGLCLIALSALQVIALWRDKGTRIQSILLFLMGFVYWTAGIILGAEGLLGHQGLMESPFILVFGAHAFALSAAIRTHLEPPK
jgi:hypothetical protein